MFDAPRSLRINAATDRHLRLEGAGVLEDEDSSRKASVRGPCRFSLSVDPMFIPGFDEALRSRDGWAHALDCHASIGRLYSGLTGLCLHRWAGGLDVCLLVYATGWETSRIEIGRISNDECTRLVRLRELWRQGVQPIGRAALLDAAGVTYEEDQEAAATDDEELLLLAAMRGAPIRHRTALLADFYEVPVA